MSSRREKRGFTLVEVVVAIGLLAMIFSFSGVIFKVCIKSHRMAVANAEIMQKFRVITDQINADFKGLRKDAPLALFEGPGPDNSRAGRIMFFADGDFQSVQPYWDFGAGIGLAPHTIGQQIRGNVARISYRLIQPQGGGEWLLARTQNILTSDPRLHQWPQVDGLNNNFLLQPIQYPALPANLCRERYEHDSLSLSQWESFDNNPWSDVCIKLSSLEGVVSFDDPNTFHKIWSEHVSNFRIEWAYWDYDTDGRKVLCWFPSENPDGAGTFVSHWQVGSGLTPVGVIFNRRKGPPPYPYTGAVPVHAYSYRYEQYFSDDFYPEAFRFTFTIYDSRGVYPEGRTFTHIVYVGD